MLQEMNLKEQLEKTAEATGDLIRNKIAGKINSVCKSKSKEKKEFTYHQKKNNN